jgi:hypothetical protein
MKRYWNYLKYVLRHKYFVMIACKMLKLHPRVGLLHDFSKFKPSEFIPYAQCFYKPDGTGQYVESDAFTEAWNHHQKRNMHHWQYWVITWDRGSSEAIPMPQRYVEEMVADWMGAGRAIHGKWEVKEWYNKNKDIMNIHTLTKYKIELLLSSL